MDSLPAGVSLLTLSRTALFLATAYLVTAPGCGGDPPAPANSNPFGDVTAGDPSGRVRSPVAPPSQSAGASQVALAPKENGSGSDNPAGSGQEDEQPTTTSESPKGTNIVSTTSSGPPGNSSKPRPKNPHVKGDDEPQSMASRTGSENPLAPLFGDGSDLLESSAAQETNVPTDWAQFRGPGGSGISPFDNLPVTWSDGQNVVWTVPLPGRGSSSPIVVGDRVILTYYAGYGVGERSGNPQDLQRWIVCFDRHSGEKQWEFMAPRTPRLTAYRGEYISQHGYASSTPASDGRRIYAPFDTAGVVAIGVDGRMPGFANIGKNTHKWGSGSSPILFKDLLITNASVESGVFAAIRAGTGQLVWGIRDIEESWATPVLVQLPGGRPEVVLPMKDKIIAVDAQTGTRLWYCDGIDDYIVPSAVAADGIVYILGGRAGKSMAIRAGGRGDVTRSHVLWTSDEGANVPSPIVHDGHLYFVNEDGIACCLDAQTGNVVTRRRVDTGEVYASPILAGGKLYVVSRRNGTFVFEADPQMAQVAHNTLSSDDSLFNASPAVADGQIFLRSDRALYCIRQQ